MSVGTRCVWRRGMTLIEVLVALALLLALGGVSLRFVSMVGQARAGAAEREARLWGGGLLMEHLERDLLTAFAGDGPAIVGEGQSITITRLRFAGEAPELATRGVRYDAGAGAIVASGEGVSRELLVSDVRWLAFRYLDGERWVGSTADLDGRVPRAVEVSVWFGAVSPREESEGEAVVDGPPDGAPDRPADRRRLVPVFGVVDVDDDVRGGERAGVGA